MKMTALSHCSLLKVMGLCLPAAVVGRSLLMAQNLGVTPAVVEAKRVSAKEMVSDLVIIDGGLAGCRTARAAVRESRARSEASARN
jgi:hypothetical protein